ncbi:MAG: hemerythrin domain-containing protein [Firmicutes bacterium]|nr:hemerythrin domain-containing protein [Bacillota bacterium]
MDSLGLLVQQHRDIKNLVNKLRTLSLEEKLADRERAKEVRKNLSLLVGKLKVHIKHEDDFLYPSLLESKNKDVRRISKKFIDEIGDFSKVLEKFNKKYLRHSVITENPDDFITDLTGVLTKLEQRIEKEDNKLYPLVNK